jgi:PTS system mannose-specific IIA component
MIGTLILSHGKLADELLASARTISGGMEGFGAVSLDWSDGFDEAQAKIRAALELLDRGDGVLVLTDMFGGTPCNVALTFLDPGRVEIVTGVNLPMVVRLACLGDREMPIQEVARWLREKSRASICLASDIQGQRCGPPAPCGDGVAHGAEADRAEAVPERVEAPVGAGHEGGG